MDSCEESTALENASADTKMRGTVKPKVDGLSKKLNSYRFLCLVSVYVDELELITPISKAFEVECLLITEIQPTLSETLENIDNEIEIGGTTEEYSTCNFASFTDKDNNFLEYSYLAANDSQKNNLYML